MSLATATSEGAMGACTIRTTYPARFRDFISRFKSAQPVAVLCHGNADGLAAGALLACTLQHACYTAITEITGKGEHAWSEAVRARLLDASPCALL